MLILHLMIRDEKIAYIKKKYELKLFSKDSQIDWPLNQDVKAFLYWEGKNQSFGFLDTNTSDTLFSLRQQIVENGIPINGSYLFLFQQTPVSYVQEQKMTVRDIAITINKKLVIILRQGT